LQNPPAGTETPQAPQLLRSTLRETQEPPQFDRPLPQQTPLSLWKPTVQVGVPLSQMPPAGTWTPHAPQLFKSSEKNAQKPPLAQQLLQQLALAIQPGPPSGTQVQIRLPICPLGLGWQASVQHWLSAVHASPVGTQATHWPS
jgi:hypothetical protein